MDYFPNLYIGITGVITYATNTDTSTVIKNMIPSSLRILLETDAPYMVPANLYNSIPELKGKRLPISHSAMIPWTADFVAGLTEGKWDAERVMIEARENAKRVYGI